jgi:GTP-binding protein
MFVDRARVIACAGDGGDGCASFRREKFLPFGGPNGGDGGLGGSVIFRAVTSEQCLQNLKYQQHWQATRGEHGTSKDCNGRRGDNCIVPVPIGTLVRDANSGELLADLTAENQECVVARGGAGGKGNLHFVTSTNRAPRTKTAGEAGERRTLQVDLKVVADVGLVGYPNAGKSTLISAISDAHPKTAPYPFTTLHPNVGVVRLDELRRFTVADIPGLIDGAHLDVGLGHGFLRHIERCRALCYVLDLGGVDGRDPLEDLAALRRELEFYLKGLSRRPAIIVANKMDLEAAPDNLRRLREQESLRIVATCAELMENQPEIIEALRELLASLPATPPSAPPAESPRGGD